MTSTACDDQFLPPLDDLESQCREARAKVKDVCVHKVSRGCLETQTECGQIYEYCRRFVFCPFCGKRIEVRK
jgi:hypothetical protein